MPEAKQTEQKMQSFDDVLFTMTSFSAKSSEKNIQKKICIYLWNLDTNAKLKEKNEKKDISLKKFCNNFSLLALSY